MLYRLSHRFSVDGAGRPLPAPSIADAAAHYRAGRLDDAGGACRAILVGDKRHFDALHLLGVICTDQGDLADALAELTAAEQVNPNDARLQYHIGNVLMAQDHHANAEARFRRALTLDPNFVDAINNLGTTLRAQDRDTEAVAWYRRALVLHPGHPPAHYNLGLALSKRGELEAAAISYRAALAGPTDPATTDKLAGVHDALAQTLMELQRYDETLAVCRARCALKPNEARGEWHESLALLTLGRFREGWPKYERRWELEGFRTDDEAKLPLPRAPAMPALHGRRVLLRAEQWRGDVIQFARYAPLIARHASSVTLAVPADLIALMQTLPDVDAVIADTDPEPAHDVAAALMSLPLVFGTELATIPRSVPYLRPPPAQSAAWRDRLGPRTRPRIGICWWGSQHIPERSIPLPGLAPLLATPGIEFHAVQKEIGDADRGWLAEHTGVARHDAALTDFAETAALISMMDLIVTIDTAVAHLAGALGVPTWITLRRSPDWRWLTGRADSPWYPSARLFRQAALGGWPAVVAAVRAELDRRFDRPI